MTNSIFEYTKEMFPKATDDMVDTIIWEHTSYPVSDLEICKQQLNIYKHFLDNTTIP